MFISICSVGHKILWGAMHKIAVFLACASFISPRLIWLCGRSQRRAEGNLWTHIVGTSQSKCSHTIKHALIYSKVKGLLTQSEISVDCLSSSEWKDNLWCGPSNVPSHLPEPAAECPTSPESLTKRMCLLDMEDKEKEDLCVGSLPQQRTKIQESQNRMNPEDEPQRLRPPD